MTVHTLQIDGADVAGTEGQSILAVATENGIDIPTMCHLDGLSDTGSCRLCVVEIAGSTEAAPGLHDRRRRGHGGHDRLGAARPSTAGRSSRCCSSSETTSARSASPTTTASSRTSPRTCGVDHFELPVDQPVGRRSTPATRCSPSTTTAASCASAACGSATRSRAPTPGASWARASTRASSPTWARRGASRRPAPAAASASRSARPARCSRRAARSREGSKERRPFLPYLAAVHGQERGRRDDRKPRLATVWLDGCSGCHMSFLDMDERLLEIAERADIVYSPLVDTKEYPDDVDVCLVEGAVSSEDDLHKIRHGPRADADAGLVRRLRGHGQRARDAQPDRPGARCCERAYVENVTLNPGVPTRGRAGAAADGPAGAPRRQGRRVPAGLPAVGRPHLPRARSTCSRAATPDTRGARFGR